MENQTPQNLSDREYIMLALQIIGDFGATIAIPVVGFVILGQWLEREYGYAPWFTIAGFVLAALLSGRMIYKKAKEYNVRYQNIEKRKNQK